MQPLATDKGTSSKSMQLLPGHWYGSLPTPSLKGLCPLWLSHASKTVPNEFLLTCSSSGKPGGSNPFPDTTFFLPGVNQDPGEWHQNFTPCPTPLPTQTRNGKSRPTAVLPSSPQIAFQMKKQVFLMVTWMLTIRITSVQYLSVAPGGFNNLLQILARPDQTLVCAFSQSQLLSEECANAHKPEQFWCWLPGALARHEG